MRITMGLRSLLFGWLFIVVSTQESADSCSNSITHTTGCINKAFKKYNLNYHAPLNFPQSNGHISIYLHAAVGIFKKKRILNETACLQEETITGHPCKTWGYGNEILHELLSSIKSSGLLNKVDAIYVTALGHAKDRSLTKKILKDFSPKANLMIEGDNIYLAEFPTLFVLQMHSQLMLNTSLILYMHTKGMRNQGKAAADWRRYMTYFLVDRFSICIRLLHEFDYETCGVLKDQNEYAGNFWWTRASWVKQIETSLSSGEWSMRTRMAAEDFLLTGVTEASDQHHYCIHTTHHNMYDCPTPRHLYAPPRNDLSLSNIANDSHYMPRPNANCYSWSKLAVHDITFTSPFTGQEVSMPCHIDHFPPIAD